MNRLTVFGFGIAECNSDGVIYTSNAAMAYFEELLEYFDSVDVFIPLVTTPHDFKCKFTDPRFKVHGYGQSKLSFLMSYIPFLKSVKKSHVLVFIPASSRLAPIYSWVKKRSESTSLYVADDPFEFIGKLSLSRIPGYDQLYKSSVIKFISLSNPVFAAGKKVKSLCEPYAKNVYESLPQGQPLPKSDGVVKNQDKGSERTILFLNRVVFNKGIKELLQGFELLSDRRPEKLKLIYTGDGDALNELKILASKSKYSKYIEFSGWVDDQRLLEDIWSRADVYILPSTHTEGRPRGVEEAIVRRVPCVATKVGGIPAEHGNGQVYLIEPGQPEEIALALEKVLFDENCRERILECAENRRSWLLDNGSAAKQHASLILSHS